MTPVFGLSPMVIPSDGMCRHGTVVSFASHQGFITFQADLTDMPLAGFVLYLGSNTLMIGILHI
jgi:hypothetical protein